MGTLDKVESREVYRILPNASTGGKFRIFAGYKLPAMPVLSATPLPSPTKQFEQISLDQDAHTIPHADPGTADR